MYIYIKTNVSGDMDITTHPDFESAFEACSNDMEQDFSCNRIYEKDKMKDLILKHKSVKYRFGWYDPVVQTIVEATEKQDVHPYKFGGY